MGVDYRAVLMVGTACESSEEAVELLERTGKEFSEEDLEDGLAEYLYGQDGGLVYERLNYYTGDDYGVLGYELPLTPYDTFAERVSLLQKMFQDRFGVQAEVISEVQIY